MITNAFGEPYLYAVNRDMFERESAQARIEREFGELLSREDSLIIFVGSDSGNIIRYVTGRELPPGTRYIFIEPEELLPQVAATIELDEVSDRVLLITPDRFGEAAKQADITSYLYVDGIVLRRSLSAEYGFVAQYRIDYWELDSQVRDLSWNTIVSLGKDAFVQCQLRNSADNLHPLSEIRGCLEGRSVIVLGGGPSLDEHLDWINAHRQQLVVVAVSRISARLQQVGLEPDFVFSVDPQDISYQVSKEMLNFGPRVVLVNQYHIVPRLLAQWPHRKFFMGQLLPWRSGLNPVENCVGAGPTVTNAAIAAAAWLGSRQILLAGVDLCFTPEGYTHARGSKERAAGPKTDLSNLSVITNAGEVASTTSDYAAAAKNIGWQASVLEKQGVSLINLSSGAARMDNVLYRTTDDIELGGFAGDLGVPWPDASDSQDGLHSLQQELEERLGQVEEIQAILQQATGLHASMYENDAVDPLKKDELERLDSRLADEYPDVLKLVKTLSVRGLLRMAQSLRDPDDLELGHVREKLDAYYASLEFGARRLREHLEAGLDTVSVRLEEQVLTRRNAEEASKLAERWIERSEPGRASIVALDPSRMQALGVARDAYRKEMERDQLADLTRQNKLRNLHALPARIQHLKDREDLDALERLNVTLAEDPEAAAFLPLITATLYRMKQQPEQALLELLPVMEQPDSPMLEQALAMMVSLCAELGHHQAVLDAMAGLASLNAWYLNLYADALAANGQAGDAIEHLTEYLHYFRGDKQAAGKLVRWYTEQGNSEGAALARSLLED